MTSTLARLSITMALAHLTLGAALAVPTAWAAVPETADVPGARRAVTFEMNQGQADAAVQFIARSPGAAMFVRPAELSIALGSHADTTSARSHRPRPVHEAAPSQTTTASIRMTMVGADPAAPFEASDPLPARTNYVGGIDASHWLHDVPSFASVKYQHIYPGIDLVYHARDGQLEYDFIVGPGADPRAIRLQFEGTTSVEIEALGDLVLRTPAADIRKLRPEMYQEVDGRRRSVDGNYVLAEDGRVAFEVGSYDRTLPLVIDPVIAYSTFWGGTANDGGRRIAVDVQGNVYVVGNTESANFPTTAGAAQRAPGGSRDVFVTKFSPSGAVIYSTYIGGGCDDSAGGIAVDNAGNAYVTGRHNTCLWNTNPVGAFVVKLGPSGAALYHKVLAASSLDDSWGQAVAVDAQGNAYVTGVTSSSSSRDFPTTAGAYRTTDCGVGFLAGYDGFVAKLNPFGGLVYSTYLCGTMNDSPNSIKVDATGSAYVVGSTESHDFPTVHPIQAENKGSTLYATGFVTKLKPDGSGLVYSTYLGGSSGDAINDVALDGAGNAYVTGDTGSADFPVTPGVIQTQAGFPICALSGCSDAFATKINATGTALVYSTYIAAESDDIGTSIAVDGAGNAYVAGATWSSYLPIVDAFQSSNRGSQDGFVVKLNATATRFLWASYLGGSTGTTESLEGEDAIIGIALDGNGNAYVTGDTLSRDFPVTAGAVQRTLSGGPCDYFGSPCDEAFMTKISAGGPGVVPKTNVAVTPTDFTSGGILTATWNGISSPTAADQLNLYRLGGLSDSTNRVASWSTTHTASGTLQLRLPATIAPGWYELRLLTPDPTQFGVPGVVARSAPINIGPHADMLVTALTNPPAIASPGGSFLVTDTTANRGSLATTGSVTRFYLSLDRLRNSGDRLLAGTRSVGVLAPNAVSTGTTSVTIPATTPIGTYAILACADDTSTNVESNEGNNCIASVGSVSIGAPDLAAAAVNNPPAAVRIGASFTAGDTTVNHGSAASSASVTRYYLSLDRVRSAGDPLLVGARSVPALVSNGVSTGAATVTIPATTPVGNYFLLACADDTKVSAESNETNNCVASTTAVRVGP